MEGGHTFPAFQKDFIAAPHPHRPVAMATGSLMLTGADTGGVLPCPLPLPARARSVVVRHGQQRAVAGWLLGGAGVGRPPCKQALHFWVLGSPYLLKGQRPAPCREWHGGDSYMFCAPLRPMWPSAPLGRLSLAELQGQSLWASQPWAGVMPHPSAAAGTQSGMAPPGPQLTHVLTSSPVRPHSSWLHSSRAHRGKKIRSLVSGLWVSAGLSPQRVGGDSSDTLSASKTRYS